MATPKAKTPQRGDHVFNPATGEAGKYAYAEEGGHRVREIGITPGGLVYEGQYTTWPDVSLTPVEE